MHTITQHASPMGTLVDENALCYPGCHRPVRAERPTCVHGAAAAGPEFSHEDGSELCANGRGQMCEPVEATR